MSMNIRKTILNLRHEKGYTQENLAEMLGVTTAAVSKWETGNAFPDITLLPQIAEIFDVSIDYLFGYNTAEKKTISETITEANRLSKERNYEGSIAIIAKTLARYPNNDQLIFELARHRLISAQHKYKNERMILLEEAEKGFDTVTKSTENDNRRAWAYHFLTTIAMIQNRYDKARFYNSKIVGGKGLYPKVERSIIEMKQHDNKEALHLCEETMYESIIEYSYMLNWVMSYRLHHNHPNEAIREGKRATLILEEFNGNGMFNNDLSVCSESVALAYAMTGDYKNCLLYLEKAYEYADKYDKQKNNLVNDADSIVSNKMEEEERVSSKKSLYSALQSDERKEYDPIREDERFKNIMSKLSE